MPKSLSSPAKVLKFRVTCGGWSAKKNLKEWVIITDYSKAEAAGVACSSDTEAQLSLVASSWTKGQ